MSIVEYLFARVLALLDRGLARDERGAVSVEYIALFGTVTVAITVAMVKLGPGLLTAWGQTKQALLAGKP
jgi:Flp pilus assembly pilin Flp